MITWGISANSHDAAVAVFDNDNLLFASHSERFSGKKNDPDLCNALVNHAVSSYGYPDEVIWYERPVVKTLRQLYAGQGFRYRNNDVRNYLRTHGVTGTPISYQWHHESHAAAGYYTSTFDQAAVVVIDAIGEFETLTIWQGQGNNIKKIYSQRYPDSLGLWYSAMTQRCYLKPNEEEYILMGMAAYGDATRLKDRIKEDFFKHTRKLVAFKRNLHRGCQDWAPELTVNDSFDIAAATQAVYEEYFEKIVAHAKRITGSDNLVIMGGCALNCMANPIAYRHFENVWIMPNPGDAGSAVGAVLANRQQRITWDTCSLGFDITASATSDQIVDYLDKNKMCGVAQGRAEFGPRALGNRSLLADPRGPDIKHTVNAIKQRQQFRPFAPMILEELAEDYFELAGASSDHRYMQFISRCRHPELFPAVIHRDGTSRVQTVPKHNSSIRSILELWYQLTGCPMLLNTSLNIKGQPMVNDQADAAAFERHYAVRVFT